MFLLFLNYINLLFFGSTGSAADTAIYRSLNKSTVFLHFLSCILTNLYCSKKSILTSNPMNFIPICKVPVVQSDEC